MEQKAFSVTGKTVLITGATSPPTGVQVPEAGTNGGYQFRVHNAGSELAFLAVGSSAAEAQSNAVVPTGSGANSKNVVVLPVGVVEVLSFPLNSYFSVVTVSGTASVYICSGKGV